MLNLLHLADSIKYNTMNKISNIASQYKISFCLLILCFAIVSPHAYASDLSDKDLEQRVKNLSSAVDMRYSADVHKHIKAYTTYNKKGTEIILGRTSIYFPMFENILRDRGLPTDLKYLAVIESGLKPTATSKVGAAGLWQFMKSTGRMMGLNVNKTLDERRDPVKSTEAAAEYLKYLNEKFGDWTLALAAYNCGPGNVRKAIRKSGGKKTFWEIKEFLPRETRNYIPKFIAITYLMNYYYDHGIMPVLPEDHLMNTSSAQVYDKISLRTVSANFNISLSIVKLLNPAYIRNVIPASVEGRHLLTLPTDHMISYVNGNQSATLLSRPYSLTTPVAAPTVAANTARELLNIEQIKKVSLTTGANNDQLYSTVSLSPANLSSRKKYNTTKLRIRETLADVAKRAGVSLETLLELNKVTEASTFMVGSTIVISEQ